jgi:hypothetical protein
MTRHGNSGDHRRHLPAFDKKTTTIITYIVFVVEETVPCPKLVVGMRIHREIHNMPTQAWAWHPASGF